MSLTELLKKQTELKNDLSGIEKQIDALFKTPKLNLELPPRAKYILLDINERFGISIEYLLAEVESWFKKPMILEPRFIPEGCECVSTNGRLVVASIYVRYCYDMGMHLNQNKDDVTDLSIEEQKCLNLYIETIKKWLIDNRSTIGDKTDLIVTSEYILIRSSTHFSKQNHKFRGVRRQIKNVGVTNTGSHKVNFTNGYSISIAQKAIDAIMNELKTRDEKKPLNYNIIDENTGYSITTINNALALLEYQRLIKRDGQMITITKPF